MANIKSAKKRIRVIQAKTLANKMVKTNLKSMIKKANAAIENGAEDAAQAVRLAEKTIDQACAKGVLHPNTASRRKSSLIRKLNAAG